MRKSLAFTLAIPLALLLVTVQVVSGGEATGTLVIGPEGDIWPVMLSTSEDFEIWVRAGGDPTTEPQILLVMTEECYLGLTGNVVVTWDTGSISFGPYGGAYADFTGPVSSGYIPPSGTTEGARYTVASLIDHISHGLPEKVESIYWAWGPFLPSGTVLRTYEVSYEELSVDLPSASPRMLVYALGKHDSPTEFNTRVPPTNPMFMVPELGTILLVAASFSALALYALKRRT